MTKVVSVRFTAGGRIYYFDPGSLEIKENDHVIVETARGVELAEVAKEVHEVPDEMVVQPLKGVLRIATAEDERKREEYSKKEDKALKICEEKVANHKLDMKLVSAEYAFDGSKLVFYFTADDRVDFRELVKDLASEFKTRIELRQIGVRDEARMLGGLGSCGRPVCCNSFLDEFRPVSIKMAKDQNLSLSPTKISGLCGRLMCCLQYEQAAYEDMKKKMPKVGKKVLSPAGEGTVIENNAITEKTRVKTVAPDGTIEVHEYHYSQLAQPGEELPVVQETEIRPEEEKKEENPVSAEYIPPEVPEKKEKSKNRNRRRRPKKRPEQQQQGAAPEVKTENGANETAPKKSNKKRRRWGQKKKAKGTETPDNS